MATFMQVSVLTFDTLARILSNPTALAGRASSPRTHPPPDSHVHAAPRQKRDAGQALKRRGQGGNSMLDRAGIGQLAWKWKR